MSIENIFEELKDKSVQLNSYQLGCLESTSTFRFICTLCTQYKFIYFPNNFFCVPVLDPLFVSRAKCQNLIQIQGAHCCILDVGCSWKLGLPLVAVLIQCSMLSVRHSSLNVACEMSFLVALGNDSYMMQCLTTLVCIEACKRDQNI